MPSSLPLQAIDSFLCLRLQLFPQPARTSPEKMLLSPPAPSLPPTEKPISPSRNYEERRKPSSHVRANTSSISLAIDCQPGNCERERSASLWEGEMGMEGRATSSPATSGLDVERARDKGRGENRSPREGEKKVEELCLLRLGLFN
ncbi:hypothetical protein MRB53_013615 [Persea americana]|uniref:Uncharacterized protein n=1 Tax=Persea americana TaxID=3435 RepID=A0ACC2K8Y0_PERAE|nr:hypothetical protein MRB53_013615 [Persea americana]